jgi:hypothetical protein
MTLARLFAFVLLGSLLLAPRVAGAATPQRWLIVSDVHFDPFSDPRIVGRLNAAPVERWRGIFASTRTAAFSNYGSDTNYPLLESALQGMNREVSDPDVVIVAGDFLAHDFQKKFQAATKLQDEPSYEAFVDKTIAFLASEFHVAFPRARFVPVIGNNDSYCGDYASTPNSPFLAHMAQAWKTAVAAPDANAWAAQFATGGYYSLPLPIAGAQAVVLNDVFWSAKYANHCGEASADPGGDELTWLRRTLSQNTAHRPVWVIGHIPVGVDVFSTLMKGMQGSGDVTMMLADPYNAALIALLGDPRLNVVMSIVGHTHMNAFRVLGPDASHPVAPMLLVPSISPVYNNNPAFTIADVDPQGAGIEDERVFVLQDLSLLAKGGKRPAEWGREYDFGSVFGHGALDAAHLDGVEHTMFDDERVRMRFEEYYDSESGRAPITEATWRAYWCGNVALTATSFAACAMPQIQRPLPTQPTAPPAPPTQSPSPAPSPSGSP